MFLGYISLCGGGSVVARSPEKPTNDQLIQSFTHRGGVFSQRYLTACHRAMSTAGSPVAYDFADQLVRSEISGVAVNAQQQSTNDIAPAQGPIRLLVTKQQVGNLFNHVRILHVS